MSLLLDPIAPAWAKRFVKLLDRKFLSLENPTKPTRLPSYATSELPLAQEWVGCVVYDKTAGAVKVSNGTNWS